MTEKFVTLMNATNPVLDSVSSAILLEAGIPFEIFEESAMNLVVGGSSPMSSKSFRVPASRLQEAKDLLCANGVVCEVTDRLLKRSLEEVVKPLLQASGRNLERLVYLARINNKETVRSLFEATLRLPGGQDLLEDLFFAMAAEGLSLSTLARIIKPGKSLALDDKFESQARAGAKPARLALLDVLPEFRGSPLCMPILLSGLRDPDEEIRDAASEALFGLKIDDAGYDPQASPEEREESVREIEREAGMG